MTLPDSNPHPTVQPPEPATPSNQPVCLGMPFWLSGSDLPLPIDQISPASLAYIGDAVYELYVRTRYLLPPKRLAEYHQQVVAQVRAETQAAYLKTLETHLTAEESEIVRRGRNSASGKPRRLAPELYQQATSLEALIGYLYLKDPQRLWQLLEKLDLN